MAKRWNHSDVARSLHVPEDVVRRIYAAVQESKKQGLYGGHYADYIERALGRHLTGGEYTVADRAKKHLGYDPPSGYQGPAPKGKAKEPSREYDKDKVAKAQRLAAQGEHAISDVMRRRKLNRYPSTKDDEIDRALLKEAAGELDVAADLFELAGPRFQVRAGTLHQQAKHARQGDFQTLQYMF